MLTSNQAKELLSGLSKKAATSSTPSKNSTSQSRSSPLDGSNMFKGNGEKLDITKDELDRIEQCMKDPKFMKMFEEYVDEISDPEALKETDLYIKQLEKEGTQLPTSIIIPKPAFCIQCPSDEKKSRTFVVNICSSDKVDIFKEEKTKKDKSSGSEFRVPLVVGSARQNEKQTVLDVVFNTKTCEKAEKDVLFKDLICGLALEYVEQKCNVKLKKQFYTMMLGIKSVGEPSSLTLQSLTNEPKREKLDPQNILKDILPADKEPEMELKISKEEPRKSNLIQEFNDPITPKYEIVYKNTFDMSEYTYTTPTATNRTKPSEMGIRIFLPMLDSISGVDLDVSENFLKLDCSHPQKYHLDIHLPYSVLSEKVTAKFDKKTKTLKVGLIVSPDALEKVHFEELKPEELEEKPKKIEETKAEVFEEPEVDVQSQQPIKLQKAPTPFQTSSFVQKTPQDIDIAANDLKSVNISDTVNQHRVDVKDVSAKKLVTFSPSEPEPRSSKTKDFKNKYLYEID